MSLMPMVCFTLTAPTAFYSKACRKVLGHYPWKVLDWPGNYAPHGHADPQIKVVLVQRSCPLVCLLVHQFRSIPNRSLSLS